MVEPLVGKMMRIFVSYASDDIGNLLEVLGKYTNNDSLEFDYLDHHWYYFFWKLIVKRKMDKCDYVLFLESPRSKTSKNVLWELNLAREKGKIIFKYTLSKDDAKMEDTTILIGDVNHIPKQIEASEDQRIKGVLFHGQKPIFLNNSEKAIFYQQYKMMVDSSEALVKRRQIMNSYYLTMEAAILAFIGTVIKNLEIAQTGEVISFWGLFSYERQNFLAGLPIALACIMGMGIAWSWKRLIDSYGQLNTGKFAIINQMEEYLPASIFKAEWKVLGEGNDKKRYSAFTKIVKYVPSFWMVVYFFVVVLVVRGVC